MSERSYNIIARIVGLFLLLIAGVFLAIQIPSVQTSILRKVTDKLEKSINGTLQYSDISISPTGALLIKDIAIIDNNPYTADEYECGWAPKDTLFCAKTISAAFSLKGLLKKEGLHFSRVYVDGGSFNLVSEPVYDTYLHPKSNIQRIFNLPGVPEDKVATPGPSIFDARKFKVTNFRYTMTSFMPRKGERSSTCIRYDNMDVLASEISGHGMKFTGGKMYATCDHCACTEKSGYEMYDLSGECEVGLGRTLVRNIHLVDPWSDMHLKMFSMSYRNSRVFKHFLTKILLEAEFDEGVIGFPTITYFSSALPGNTATIQTYGGHFKGYVSDFQIDDLEFTELTSGISATLNGSLKGIPKTSEMSTDAKLTNASFTGKQLNDLLKAVTGSSVPTVRKLAPGQTFTLDASVKGPLNNADVNATLASALGTTRLEGTVMNLLSPGKSIEVAANASTQQLNIGKLLGIDAVGPVTTDFVAKATLGKQISARVDSLGISSISLLGKEYRNIKATGSYSPSGFGGRITSADPKLRMVLDATGQGGIASGDAIFNAVADISQADLHALGLDKNDESVLASMKLTAGLQSTGKNNFNSSAVIGDIKVTDSNGEHQIPDINATYASIDGNNDISLSSDMMTGEFSAACGFGELIAALQDASSRRELSALYKLTDEDDEAEEGEPTFALFNANFNFLDTRGVLDYLMPGAYIADGSTFNIDMNEDGILQGKLKSQRLAIGRNNIRNAELTLDNLDGQLRALLTGDELSVGSFSIADPNVTATANDNDFLLTTRFAGTSAANGRGEISIAGNFSRDECDTLIINAHPQLSYIKVSDGIWEIGESDIVIRGKDIDIDNFNIHNGDQSIFVNGGISGTAADTLDLAISKVGLALIDNFLPQKYGFDGELNGTAYLISPTANNLGMMLRMDATDVKISGTDAGTFTLAGRWDEEEGRIKAYLNNVIDGRESMNAIANFDPKSKKLDAGADFDHMSPAIALPFVSSIFSSVGGSIDGRLRANGSLDSLSLASKDFKLEEFSITPIFTGVTYKIDGPVNVSDHSIDLENVTIVDGGSGKGTLNGKLSHNHLKDMSLNATMRFRQMEVLDLKESDKMGYYGNLLASGSVNVIGPFDDLKLEGQVTTTGDGNIHIPLNSALVGSTSNLLTFKEPDVVEDPYDIMMNQLHKARKSSSGSFSAKAKVTATPGVTAYVELDKDSGNILSAYGSGTVDLDIRPAKDVFTINGDYNIAGGKFHVNLANLIDRELSIRNGGFIKFNGAIPESELDVTAMYTVRTSLSTLVAETKDVSSRRNVEASLRIHDKLSSLATDFDVNIPDLDPVTKAQVESALNTDDKMQKQFVALLMLGSFVPSESSGVFNGSNALYSNMSSIVVGQINNIMQKLEIPVGFGFDYSQNNYGTSIFDVAIGTQLFNNRVEVNGSLGNREYSTSGGQTSIVGDFDASLKLDKAGQFRLNAFSHSADEYTSFLDYSQRNGGGVSYQVDFNNMSDLLKSIFKKKYTPEGRRGQGTTNQGGSGTPSRQYRSRSTVTITIDNEHK